MHFIRVKKSRKRSDFVISSYFKDSVFTVVKRDAKLQTRFVKGVSFLSKCCIHIKGLVVGPRGILGDPGVDSGGVGKSKRGEKYGTKKSKERREEPLGTMSYQTSSKRSPPFCLLIRQKNTKVFWRIT